MTQVVAMSQKIQPESENCLNLVKSLDSDWKPLTIHSVIFCRPGHANFIREYYGDGNKYVVETDDDGTGGRSTVEIETVDTGDNFV